MNDTTTTTVAKTASQAITPQLRQWIIQQAQAGHSPESLLKAMRTAGWDENLAIDAMEETLRAHLNATDEGANVNAADANTSSATAAAPEPSLEGSPLYLDAGDRRVAVLAAMDNPRIVMFGNLLSDEECDALIAAARPRMARSLTVERKTGGQEVNAARTSNGMFFSRGENEVVARIETRLAKLVNWPVENGEGIQILNYQPGAEYKPHYDYFDPDEPGTPSILQRGGQRVGTVVLYLNDPEKGGGTSFPDAGFVAGPRRGNGVFFSYPNAHPSSRTLHGGAPVIAGEKWIATKWMRQREFK